MRKSLPFYYLAILWIAAAVSVFLIVRPLVTSGSGKNDSANTSDFTVTPGNNENPAKAENNSIADGNKQEQSVTEKNDNDLIFYDKTAFIRYFSDKYSEEELTVSYNNALADKTNNSEKATILVVRKGSNGKTRKSFSGSFDIRPVPGN